MITFIVVLLFVTTFPAIVGIGCGTPRDSDKDVSNAGKGIQNGVKESCSTCCCK